MEGFAKLTLLFFYLIISMLSSVFCISAFQDVIGTQFTHKEQLNKFAESTDLTFLIVFYRNDSPNSQTIGNMLVSISKRLEYLATIIKIDCEISEEEFPECVEKEKPSEDQEEDKDQFPKLALFKPAEFKINPYTKKKQSHEKVEFEKDITNLQMLRSFIIDNIISRSLKLSSSNFELFTKYSNKIVKERQIRQ